MRKIISLFQRNYDGDRLVRDEVVPGAEWVLAGEGKATRKYDGTCCLLRDGKLYKRLDVKPGKTPPADFEEEQYDPTTGKRFGWVPVGEGPDDKWHRDAWEFHGGAEGLGHEGTYELCGPKVQGNPEGYPVHMLICHECAEVLDDVPREFEGIKRWLAEHRYEGIVWHHDDGRMVKIKAKDFGIRRSA